VKGLQLVPKNHIPQKTRPASWWQIDE